MTVPAAPPPEMVEKLADRLHFDFPDYSRNWAKVLATNSLTAVWPDVLALVAAQREAVEQELRERIAGEVRAFLHEVSDMLDPVEGPVIIAWSTDVLADRITERVVSGSPAGQETP